MTNSQHTGIWRSALRRQWWIPLIVCLGMALWSLRLHSEPAFEYDFGAHIDTIQHYADTLTMAEIGVHGKEAHQPPLYYFLAGLLWRFEPEANVELKRQAMQPLSYGIFLVFLFFGVRLILFMVRDRLLRLLAILTLLIWPAHYVHACRISNDMMLHATFLASSYYQLRWWRQRKPTQMAAALVWMGLSLMSKHSALLLLPMLALVSLHVWLRAAPLRRHAVAKARSIRVWCRSNKWILLALAVLAGCVYLSFYRTVEYFFAHRRVAIISGVGGIYYFALAFMPFEYVYFDWQSYITAPYASMDADNYMFFNYFPRTMLYGEFVLKGLTQAAALNVLLMSMWVLGAGLMFHHLIIRQGGATSGTICGAFLLLCMAALAGVKTLYHIHPWADVRHVYAVIPYFIAIYAQLLQIYRRSGKSLLANTGMVLMIAFIIVSGVHLYRQVA